MSTTNKGHLRIAAVSLPSVIAQSVGTIAPTSAVAVVVALVFVNGAQGTWLSFFVAMVGMVGVGYCVAVLARGISSAGSFYAYAARTLGSAGALFAGSSLLLAYLFVPIVSISAFVIYILDFLGSIGINVTPDKLSWTVTALVGVTIAGVCVYRGVKVSTYVTLVLEAVSLTIMGALFIVVFFHTGTVFDSKQLSLSGATFNGVGKGVLLAIFAVTGFEAAAVLGREAKNPFRAIPRAVLGSVIGVGLIYTVGAYIIILAFSHSHLNLGTSANSLTDVAHIVNARVFDAPLSLGIALSTLGGGIGCLNGASRMWMDMSRERVIGPRRAGDIHPVYQTPYVALGIALVLNATAMVVLYNTGTDPLSAIGYVGTFGTFAFAGGYVLVCIAAPVFARRSNDRVPLLLLLAAVVGILASLGALYVTVYPVPPAPYNWLPYVWVGFMVCAGIWFMYLRSARPDALRMAGMGDETITATDDPPAATGQTPPIGDEPPPRVTTA
jgi:amino acid transporter